MTKHNFSKCLTSKHANTNTSLVKVVDMPIMCYIFKSLWHKDFKINVPECLMFKYTNNCSAGFPFNTGSSAVEHLVTFLKYEGRMLKSSAHCIGNFVSSKFALTPSLYSSISKSGSDCPLVSPLEIRGAACISDAVFSTYV